MQMRASPVLFVDIPFEERLQFLVVEYGKGDKEKIMNAILRIQKRLGPLETKTAINHLLENDFYGCFSILLKYYDKYYLKGLHNRDNFNELVTTIPCTTVNAAQNVLALTKTSVLG
jgi:tRNA 2-selenouridine synthase